MSTGYYTVAFKSTGPSGVELVNTFAVKWDDNIALEDPGATDITTALANWLVDDYVSILPSAITFDELTVRSILPDVEVTAAHTVGLSGLLSAGEGDLPVECCTVCTLRTGNATRSGRGRMFIPSPLASSYLDSPDHWDASSEYWSAINVFMNDLQDGHDFDYGDLDAFSAHLSLVVWSRHLDEAFDSTSFTVRSRPHWLRSRSTSP
jgi:hypothetical protein